MDWSIQAARGGHAMSTPQKPGIDALQRDIEFGIRFRLELDKTLLTLVTALFAFTIAFAPTLATQVKGLYLPIGWTALALSMIGGIAELHGWERFYLTYRDFEHKGLDGKPARKRITAWRRLGRFVFFTGFIVGALMIGLFAIENLPNVRPSAK
jgi:hypothetical protein